jgi:hypothetical protein
MVNGRLSPCLKHLRLTRVVAALCALVSGLLGLPTSALAFAIYDALATVNITSSQPIFAQTFQSGFNSPGGHSFSITNTPLFAPENTTGDFIRAQVGGDTLNGPASSLAFQSFFGIVGPAPVTLTLTDTVQHSLDMAAGLGETAHAFSGIEMTIDGIPQNPETAQGFNTITGPGSFTFPTSGFAKTRSLTFGTGLHTIEITVKAEGFALGFPCGTSCTVDPSLSPVPEPATLLLFGTTAAGLGLVCRRYQRRRKDGADQPVTS